MDIPFPNPPRPISSSGIHPGMVGSLEDIVGISFEKRSIIIEKSNLSVESKGPETGQYPSGSVLTEDEVVVEDRALEGIQLC